MYLSCSADYSQTSIQSNLYVMVLYIAVTLYITVTKRLHELKSRPSIYCKVDLYIAVTLYKTVTQQFPKGDHYIQV